MTMRTNAKTWQIVTLVLSAVSRRHLGTCCNRGPPEQVRNGLKGKKIAYKFEIEWEVGTFKCMYKGKNSKYKGHAT